MQGAHLLEHAKRALAVLGLASSALAGEGPSTWSSGLSTQRGQLLAKNAYEFSLRSDYTAFDETTRTEAERHAAASGSFETLDHAFMETATLAFGASEEFEVGASIGYYFGSNLVRAERVSATSATSTDADPDGLTGVWLTGKYRLPNAGRDHVAALFGLAIPVGAHDQTYADGTRLGDADQPSTDAFGYRAGLAWSRPLGERFTLDTSGLYTVHVEHEDFQVGDRADLGLALGWRAIGGALEFPSVTFVAEALGVWMNRDDRDGVKDTHSGGNAVFLSPGLRVRVNPRAAFALAPQFPVHEERTGDQIETDFKLALTLSLSY